MGGRGASGTAKIPNMGANNIVAFRPKNKANTESNKWDSRGIGEELRNIEKFYNESKRADRDAATYKSLKALEKTIQAQLEDGENDEKNLLTYRRKVRQMLNRVAKRGK